MNSLRYISLAILLSFSALTQAQSNIGTLKLTFTTVDVPGAADTNVLGINTAGDLVGDYASSDIAPPHGFKYSGGVFTLFDYPGQYWTVPAGINDSGLISGSAYAADGTNVLGFLYDGTSFSSIQAPGKAATIIYGMNSSGELVGGAGTTLSSTKAFELVGARFKNISPPGTYLYAYGTGVNNLGEIVGFILNGSDSSGFVYKNGKSRSLVFPGPTIMTLAMGLNDGGVIVGWYEGCSPACADHAFVMMKGKYFSFDYPGAIGTFADGISASGQIVGSYTLDGSTFHGYVTNPIEAASNSAGGNNRSLAAYCVRDSVNGR